MRELPADQRRKGLLTRLLPGLQEMHMGLASVNLFGDGGLREDVCLLHGHEHVRVVDACKSSGSAVAGPEWRPASSMPHLQVYRVLVGEWCLDDLVGDLACCAELQEVYVKCCHWHRDRGPAMRCQVVSGPGLLQLATGPCKDSLRSVRLEADHQALADGRQGGVPVAAAAALLHAGLPNLAELQLNVQLQPSARMAYSSHKEVVVRGNPDITREECVRVEGVLAKKMFEGLQQELSEHGVQLAGAAWSSIGSRSITVTGHFGGCAVNLWMWGPRMRGVLGA